MNKLLIFTSYTKFELNSLTNNEITIKLSITDILGCRDTAEVRNDVIDEYFMISHCQGNAKLEYNGGFRAQLGIFTGTRSVK